MFFKNAVVFRFPKSILPALLEIEERIAENPLKPLGGLDLQTTGFVQPYGRGTSALVVRQGANIWLTQATQSRILPAAAVNEVLAAKLEEIEEREGRKLGGKARKQLKDDILTEMIPRAFVVSSRTSIWINTELCVAVVDASSKKRAEAAISLIRHAMGSFPAIPVNPEVSVRSILTGWVTGQPLPEGVSLGDEGVFKDPVDGGATATVSKQDLGADEIKKHLECGKQVARVGVTVDDHVSLAIGEDLIIRKIKLLDGAMEKIENTERDSMAAELDARFALFTGEMTSVLSTLFKTFSISSADDPLSDGNTKVTVEVRKAA